MTLPAQQFRTLETRRPKCRRSGGRPREASRFRCTPCLLRRAPWRTTRKVCGCTWNWPGSACSADSTYDIATARVVSRMQEAAADFFHRMDARLAADRRRLREYYGALVREAEHKKPRGGESPDPEKLAAKKRIVDLELRRKLVELEERYAMEAVLEPLVLVRTELPVLAIDLLVQRKRAHRMHVVYWNPLLKQLEPMCCSRCGKGTYSLAFSDEEVAPLCAACSR
ncbi:MAG: hypothetical protein ACLP9L_28690 [Thermoguttaceae bacterium]